MKFSAIVTIILAECAVWKIFRYSSITFIAVLAVNAAFAAVIFAAVHLIRKFPNVERAIKDSGENESNHLVRNLLSLVLANALFILFTEPEPYLLCGLFVFDIIPLLAIISPIYYAAKYYSHNEIMSYVTDLTKMFDSGKKSKRTTAIKSTQLKTSETEITKEQIEKYQKEYEQQPENRRLNYSLSFVYEKINSESLRELDSVFRSHDSGTNPSAMGMPEHWCADKQNKIYLLRKKYGADNSRLEDTYRYFIFIFENNILELKFENTDKAIRCKEANIPAWFCNKTCMSAKALKDIINNALSVFTMGETEIRLMSGF